MLKFAQIFRSSWYKNLHGLTFGRNPNSLNENMYIALPQIWRMKSLLSCLHQKNLQQIKKTNKNKDHVITTYHKWCTNVCHLVVFL